MRRIKILKMPARISDFLADDLYSDLYDDWEFKARRLQARRWRRLKQQTI